MRTHGRFFTASPAGTPRALRNWSGRPVYTGRGTRTSGAGRATTRAAMPGTPLISTRCCSGGECLTPNLGARTLKNPTRIASGAASGAAGRDRGSTGTGEASNGPRGGRPGLRGKR